MAIIKCDKYSIKISFMPTSYDMFRKFIMRKFNFQLWRLSFQWNFVFENSLYDVKCNLCEALAHLRKSDDIDKVSLIENFIQHTLALPFYYYDFHKLF